MIPVVWWNKCHGNWDHGVLTEIFEKHKDVFYQWNDDKLLNTKKYKRQIVIVAGKPDTQSLRDYLLGLSEGIVILTSEEDAFFNWEYAIPDHLDLWTQYYSPSTKSKIKTRLLLGAPLRIKNYLINSHFPKKYLWSFVGQVQNPFRKQCVEKLKFMGIAREESKFAGFLQEVEMFGGYGANGMDYQSYLDIMCQSKFVICPAGSMCVDSFRVYEAIKCGAIPITDKRAPRDPEGFNYWDEVYPNNGLLQVNNWSELSSIMYDVVGKHILYDRDGLWFEQYEKELENKLLKYANG